MERRILLPAVLCLLLAGPVRAGDWPQWRGPAFDGSSDETGLPATFTPEDGIAWRVPMPGVSAATPIVWGDRVFTTAAESATDALLGICVDRRTGAVLWQRRLGTNREMPRNNQLASPSPVTDGRTVWFLFGSGELVAVDFDGNERWRRHLQEEHGADWAIQFGYAASPLLLEGRLFIPVLQNARQVYAGRNNRGAECRPYVLAIDAATGETLWNRPRETDALNESGEAYATPLPLVRDGRAEVVVAGGDYVTAHDPATGEELWRYGSYNTRKDQYWRLVASPVAAGGLLVSSMPRGGSLFAIRAGQTGTVEQSPPAWQLRENGPDVCTPLLYRGRLYVLDGDGRVMTCLDPADGTVRWRGRLEGADVLRASPVGADGRIYCVDMAGTVYVLATGDAFEVLARVPLGERLTQGSIAPAHGQLFLRTGRSLICIGRPAR